MEHLYEHITEILLLIFLAIVFIQSGLDKIFDWKGNLSWLTGHFSKTFLGKAIPLSLGFLLIVEMVSGVLCLVGVYEMIFMESSVFAFYGAVLSCVALLMLLFGQRLAKDYEGAKTIVIYFMPAVFLVFLLH